MNSIILNRPLDKSHVNYTSSVPTKPFYKLFLKFNITKNIKLLEHSQCFKNVAFPKPTLLRRCYSMELCKDYSRLLMKLMKKNFAFFVSLDFPNYLCFLKFVRFGNTTHRFASIPKQSIPNKLCFS